MQYGLPPQWYDRMEQLALSEKMDDWFWKGYYRQQERIRAGEGEGESTRL